MSGVCSNCGTSWEIHDGPCPSEAEIADTRALWAVRVLDAWAGPDGPGNRWRIECDEDEQLWTVMAIASHYREYENGRDPDAARLAAAEAVWPELPADVRAKLGERP